MKLAFKETLQQVDTTMLSLGSQAPDNSGVCKATGAHDGLRLVERTSSWSRAAAPPANNQTCFLTLVFAGPGAGLNAICFSRCPWLWWALLSPASGKAERLPWSLAWGRGTWGAPDGDGALHALMSLLVRQPSSIQHVHGPRQGRDGQHVHGQRPDGQYVHVAARPLLGHFSSQGPRIYGGSWKRENTVRMQLNDMDDIV